jgi:hypothetical protein
MIVFAATLFVIIAAVVALAGVAASTGWRKASTVG